MCLSSDTDTDTGANAADTPPRTYKLPFKNLTMQHLRLRFSPEVSTVICTVLNRRHFTPNERIEYWYTKQELSESRERCYSMAEEAKGDIGLLDLNDEAFKAAHDLCNRDRAAQKAFEDPSRYSHHVVKAGLFDNELHFGLDRLISQIQRTGCRCDNHRVRTLVVDMASSGVSTSEEIASACARITLPSRIHARMVAYVQFEATKAISSRPAVEQSRPPLKKRHSTKTTSSRPVEQSRPPLKKTHAQPIIWKRLLIVSRSRFPKFLTKCFCKYLSTACSRH